MTGGYKIIDLYGLDLANMQLDSTKIEKIFNDIESTYKTKALLFDNYKINGIEQNATFSSALVKNSGFEITLGDYKLLLKNDTIEDSTIHLYRHHIRIYGQDSYNDYFNVYINEDLNSNVNINTYELLINYMGDSSLIDYEGCVGYLTKYDSTYPIIYEIKLYKNTNNSSYIYYNDSEEEINMLSLEITDSIKKIF